ncbi:tRNA lysidine(34) synthetase TilS [Ectothiorhodospira lacustris]|uniref:tRNA lysidine(34) synthetase TilS n=1 Tax=Ectothiorhodospira lacustris TaxID=2899127 RepID=UPI001EE98856|nr:tRNA lysidine(34) synthetase TilS [Ectothiorhodospira lacustris]MCG5500083.1 tRNA lysidine(34) synthetase TilS [Ectothiorhodospira lacustris]
MLDTLAAALQRLPPAPRWLIGLSGGLDSHVLLHGLHGLVRSQAFPPLIAVHVHHGLSPHADQWQAHCESLCRDLGIPLQVLGVDAGPAAGESPEAAARAARYRAIAAVMQSGEVLLTAHHRRDQAETLLLQLLRGAGPAGLAAMPRLKPFGPGWQARPLLDLDRDTLADHARKAGLVWVEDDSNTDPRFDRNLLRQAVMPRLRARWPSVDVTLSRAAMLQAEAQDLLAERAREDLEQVRGRASGTLSVVGLAGLRRPRLRNALRGWLQDKGLPMPGRARLESLIEQMLKAGPDACPRVAWAGAEVRRYRDDLHAMRPLVPVDVGQVWQWTPTAPLQLPELGITLDPAVLQSIWGLDPSILTVPLTVGFRRGGEVIRWRGETRSLKKLLQEAGIPPWERDRLPLIHVDEQLVAVWGMLPGPQD